MSFSFLAVFPLLFTAFISFSTLFYHTHGISPLRSFSISFPYFLDSQRMKKAHKKLNNKPRENSGTEERIRRYTITTNSKKQDIIV
jgi:hypothetical protein